MKIKEYVSKMITSRKRYVWYHNAHFGDDQYTAQHWLDVKAIIDDVIVDAGFQR